MKKVIGPVDTVRLKGSRAKRALQATTSTWCRVDTRKSDERLQTGIRESYINLDSWFCPRFVSRSEAAVKEHRR